MITVDGVQTSSRYPAGMLLRFARVLRYRPDKRADGDDMVEGVRRLRVALLTPDRHGDVAAARRSSQGRVL